MGLNDWDHVRTFLGVVDAGSVSAAARAMQVEHTTVARRIDALELQLGLRLFDRLPRGWALTAEAQAIIPAARAVETHMFALLSAAQAEVPLAGTVRVSAPPALVSCLLARALPAALARHPQISLELLAESRTTDVLRREADIAIRYRKPEAPGLVARSLATVSYALYAAPRYAAQRKRDGAWSFLGFDASLKDTPHAIWLERHAQGQRVAMRSNDLQALAAAARDGLGAAILPSYVAQHVRGLERLDVPCPVQRKLWLVMHEDVRRSPRVRATADALAAVFEEQGLE